MNPHPVIAVQNACKTFRVQSRKDATILSRAADVFPSGTKRHSALDIEAVRDVSFTVCEGEVLGVIGKNTSGKTTLLRLIAGIFAPDSGTIFTKGNVIPLMNVSVGLHNRLSVRDNIYLACSMYGMTRAEIRDAFPSILDFAEGEKYTDMYPYQLSQGMNQRLAFSIAVHTKPEILLLDEVFSAGDIHFQKKAGAKMRELICGSVTVVMVTHNVDLVRELCDRVLLLEEGRVKRMGTPAEVCDAYAQ